MYMPLPVQQLFDVSQPLLDDALKRILVLEANEGYSFTLDAWKRVDSYAQREPTPLSKYVGEPLVEHVLAQFPGERLFGWSLSMLPAGERVPEHVDRMFFHRLAKRIIVPLGGTDDVLNWSYTSDKRTRRYYLLPAGAAYRLNTAITHGLINNGKAARRAVYFDIIDARLSSRFGSHPDLMKAILQQNTGVINVL